MSSMLYLHQYHHGRRTKKKKKKKSRRFTKASPLCVLKQNNIVGRVLSCTGYILLFWGVGVPSCHCCHHQMKGVILPLYGPIAQSIERATPGEEVPGSIPAVAARSLLVGSVSAETEVMVSQLCLMCGST